MLFWFVAPEINDYHWPSNPLVNRGQPTWLRFSNDEDFEIIVTVSQPATPSFTPIVVTIPANSTQSIQFIRAGGVGVYDLNLIENYLNPYGFTGIGRPGNVGRKGLKIESTGRMTCYYEMAGPYNMDLLALKGRNALGKEFFVPFQTNYNPPAFSATYPLIYSAIDIVATEDNTVVTITPKSSAMLLILAAQTSSAIDVSYSVTLQAGETFSAVPYGVGTNSTWNINRNAQLNGTKITSTKPIAVNTKDDLVADGEGAVDMVADQLVPTNILGKEYVIMKGMVDNGFDHVYVIPINNGTNIYKDGALVAGSPFNAGIQATVDISNNNTLISGSDTILVFHVTGINPSLIPGGPANDYNQLGGAIIPTIDVCTGSYKVSFVRSYSSDFILNVMVRDGGQNGFDPAYFTAADFTEFIAGEWWTASKSFSTAIIPSGVVTVLENFDNHLFHLGILHGSVDCFYGYFSDFNSMNVVGNVGTTINQDTKACYGERVELVAYGASTYFWKANMSPSFLTDPTAQRPVIYPTDDRKYTVIGYGDCNMKDSTEINVKVADPIVSDFVMENPGWPPCSPLEITIADFSEGVDYRYKWWYGDSFGDTLIVGTDVIPDSVYHTYNNTSDTVQVRTITLITENDYFCKDTLETEVIVYPELHAQFVPDVLIGCNPFTVNFDDQSFGNLDKYRWVFGDGAIWNTVGDVTHSYSHFNITDTVEYDVELRLTSPFFCRDTARTTIRVFPYLEGEFTLDSTYGCSPLPVTITNNSSGEDNITLDFGDGSAFLIAPTFVQTLHTYTNTGTSVDTCVVILTSTNHEGCIKVWRDTVFVYPEIRANYNLLPNQYTGCNSLNFEFTNTSNASPDAASIYLWTFGDGSTSNIASPTKLYNNTTAADKPYIFNLRAQSIYGCFDDTSNTITIYRADADFVVNPVGGCSVLPTSITNTSIGNDVPAVGGWSWNYGDGSPINTTQQPGTHLHNYTNTTNPGVDQPFNLSLTVTRNASCIDTKITTVTINPSVSVSFTTVPAGPVTICDSVQVSFTSVLVTPVPGTTYAWDFGDGTSSSLASPTHIYRNLTNAGNVTYTAQVTATTISGCTSTFSAPIIVRPYVNALFTVDKVAGCTPLTVDAIATTYLGIPAANYVWSFGDLTPPFNGNNPPAHIYPANPAPGPNDTYNLRLTVSDLSGSCSDVMNKTITVNAASLANFIPKGVSGCNPFTIDFTNTSLNGNLFLWDFGDGTTFNGADPAPKEFLNNTNATLPYTIQLTSTSTDGCTHDTSTIINVYRKVEANFGIDVSESCSPLTVNIINNSLGGTYRWYWNSQTAAGVANYTSVNATENFSHVYTNPTGGDLTFYLTLVAQNPEGCTDTLTREILVHSSITAGFTYSQPNLCNESAVVFTNTSIGGGSYTMNWNFGDGTYLSTITSPVNKTFVNNTAIDKPFTVVMTAISENGCTDSHQEVITVYSRVEANFSIPISQGCPNAVTQMFNATIENTSVGNAANVYQWYIDNVPVALAPTNKDPFIHDYQNGVPSIRKYGVRLRATNSHGCFSEKSDTITVFEYVDALFTILNPTGCTPLSVNFDNLSIAPAVTTNYLWEYGDNSSSGGFELPHLFYNADRINDKPFTIKLTVTSENYCSDVYSLPITVYHQPLAKFVADPTSSCPPLVVNMNNLDSKGYDSFQWTFGDGTPNNTTNTVLTHSYPNTLIDFVQNYKLKLWVGTTEGCTHSDSLILNVFPSVVADFTYDASGCSPFISYFTNASTNPAVIFNWNFGDGNTSSQENPFNRFVNIGNADATYNVTLTASSEYNCWDTETKSVVAYAQPIVEFDVTPTLQEFPEARVFIDNKSNLGPWNYAWTFGDGGTSSVAEPSYHDYEHWGEKDIRLQINSVTSLCADTLEKTITILPPAVNAAFTVNTDRGCEPLDIQFTASASAYTEIYTYEWEFGDGTTGTGSTPNHTYNSSGLYNVKLIARGEGGEDYEYRTIRVYKNPVANFNIAPKLTMFDQQLQARIEYFNLSECSDTLGCNYLWNFGDGSTSAEREGVYNYTELGTFDVSLVVTTSQGCKDSLMHKNEVTVVGEGLIKFPNAFTPNIDGPLGCRTDQGYDKYSNDIFFPVYAGVIKYELLVYNRWGELIFKSNNVDCGWDGYVDGKLAKQDVYVWKAQGKFTNGRAFEIAGDVTLIR